MPVKWKPLNKDIYISWIHKLTVTGDKLTDWERNFIMSLWNRLEIFKLNLTQPQAEKLESIYSKKTK